MKYLQLFFLVFTILLMDSLIVLGQHLSPSIQITARMNGNNETPAVTTDAQGLGVFTLSLDKQSVLVDIALTDLSSSVTGVHLHDGVVGATGPLAFDLTPFINGNRVQTTLTGLTTAERAKFFDASYYINIHTTNHPSGEIRAQLVHETDFRYTAYLEGSSTVPAVTTPAIGLGSVNLSKSGDKLVANIAIDGLSGPITKAHLHLGATGTTGPLLEDLTSFVVNNSVINAVINNPTYVADLEAGNVYINIHTDAYPDGEIRGQLTLQPALHFDIFMNAAQTTNGSTSSAFSVGTIDIDYNLTTLTLQAVFDGLAGPIQAVHIHEGTVGNTGPVAYDLTSFVNGNEVFGQVPLADIASLNKLLSGDYYVNIHTEAFPDGEVRGQLYKLSREGYVYDFSPENNIEAATCTGVGVGMASIDRDRSNVHYMMVLSDINEPISALHFHNAPASATGPLIYDLTPSISNFNNTATYGYWTEDDTTTPFTIDNAMMFENSEVYANVHTENCSSGAMRGNVNPGASIPILGDGEAIPTLSEWAFILLILLLLSGSTVALIQQQRVGQLQAAGTANLSSQLPTMDKGLLQQMLLKSLPFIAAIFLLISFAEGGFFLRNLLGTLASGGIIAYTIHFMVLSESFKNNNENEQEKKS